jgi:hypothetical protein
MAMTFPDPHAPGQADQPPQGQTIHDYIAGTVLHDPGKVLAS